MTDEQRERKNAYLRKWYAKNRDHQIAKAAAWEKSNPEKAAAKKREWVARHPERRKQQANRYAAKPESRAKAAARPGRKEWEKARAAQEAAELADGFVRRIMAQHTSMKGSDIPKGLVEAYRELMKLKRAINEKRG